MADSGKTPYVAMGWALMGSPKFKNLKNVKNADKGAALYSTRSWSSVFQDQVASRDLEGLARGLAMEYGSKVAQAFNRTHGRTGKTASTMSVYPTRPINPPGGAPTWTWNVAFRGHIAFVVEPIGRHTIAASSKKALSNVKSWSPRVDRTANMYEWFPFLDTLPIKEVEWYQGGAESHSPDRSWYEDEKPMLQAGAEAGFRRMSQRVKTLWAEENSGFVVLAQGKTRLVPHLP